MPELPEVETARRIVERRLAGRAVREVTVRLPKLLRTSPIPTLDPLVGQTVVAARRRAKVLVVDFTGSLSLLIHFKLAGQISVHAPDGTREFAGHPIPDPAGPYPHKTTHIELSFSDGTICYLSDVRQFGWLRLMPSDSVEAALDELGFGPEAIGATRLSDEALAARLARRGVPIKTVLLDQSVIAGIGNIYVDEALHKARIHPSTPARSLGPSHVSALNDAIAWALEMGISQGGAKIVHNKARPIDGFPEVHGRVGETCPTCGATIEKIRVGARGTYFCPVCQPRSTA
jgi:formamidopyrimidine-DNA glycosylase